MICRSLRGRRGKPSVEVFQRRRLRRVQILEQPFRFVCGERADLPLHRGGDRAVPAREEEKRRLFQALLLAPLQSLLQSSLFSSLLADLN